jgi:nitroimidazol reductase NimA-like FMN-containing flavoprotein (pyridoxamine 5'-phosphate oxidase superfamily)
MSEPASARVAVRRHPERGAYERLEIDAVLDEAMHCHVGFVRDDQPYVIPTIHARDGDHLYIHGSTASRMLRTLGDGIPLCVTATILDGLVLARSAFNHSMNYRSVVVLGTATAVSDSEKMHALEQISEHVVPGRWAEVREPNERELRQTTVLRIGLDEASVKMRSGGPKDDEDDVAMPIWAGVVPLRLRADPPVTDRSVPRDVHIPPYVSEHRLSLDGGTADVERADAQRP